MEQIARFYFNGGGFMHLVSLSFLVALAASAAGLRRTSGPVQEAGGQTQSKPPSQTLALARYLRHLCIGVGVFGSLTLLSATMHGAPTDLVVAELLHYTARAFHPTLWALALIGPLSLFVAVRTHAKSRGARPTAASEPLT